MKTMIATLALLASAALAQADNWPAWRGPGGQGHCLEKDVPLRWSETENVRWMVPLPDRGNSTPVIWDDRIFLTQATEKGAIRSLMCLARADGALLWKKDVGYPHPERNCDGGWYWNALPATDGKRVLVSFGSAGMYCFDFAGRELWKRIDLGSWQHSYGSASSPLLHGDLVFLWCGPNESRGRNFLLAVRKDTGATVWEHDETSGSWSTPLIAKVGDDDQLILSMPSGLKGFDPQTGRELWRCEGLTRLVYTSPLFANGVAVAMSGYHGAALAVKLGASGDITADRLWHHPRNVQRVGSGVIVGGHVYMVEENGLPRCYELTSGREVWQAKARLGSITWGSMVHADGRLYVLMRNGDTHVFAASPRFEVLATNCLGSDQETNSSIAIADGELFIRTYSHLWCIGRNR